MRKYMKYITLILVISILMAITATRAFAKDDNIITFTDSDREGYSYKVNEDQYIVTVEDFDPNGNFVNSTSVNKTSGEVTIKKAHFARFAF